MSDQARLDAHDRVQSLLEHTCLKEQADLIGMVSGKTEKPCGVDPILHFAPQGIYRYGRVPIQLFVGNEEGSRYDATVQMSRMMDYARRDGASAPPVIATIPRKDASVKLRILDGGHRISAARYRGDQHINAIVDVRNLRIHHSPLSSRQLPDDILDTLHSLYGEVGRDVPEIVPTRFIRLSSFPQVPFNDRRIDPRGEDHARAMIGKSMPPVIVHELDWLDGMHRVWAARQECKHHVLAIDVGLDLPKCVIEVIEPIGRLGLHPSTHADALDEAIEPGAAIESMKA